MAAAQADDPTQDLLSDFSGAWRIPGSRAVLGIGGYVKTAVVYNYDPLEIKDRFIVGSIPVGEVAAANAEAQSSITVSQSRLNFDLHVPQDGKGALYVLYSELKLLSPDRTRLCNSYSSGHILTTALLFVLYFCRL